MKHDPVDKVEPKFKVGDWVVSNDNGEVWQIGARYTEEGQRIYLYNVNDVMMSITLDELNNDYHLWTIADAKVGDVLVASDGSLFILSKVVDTAAFHYFSLCKNGSKEIGDGNHAWESVRGCHPATKEERELLYAEMKEAGWEWNCEKKELKKIETTAWNEEDEKIALSIKQIMNCASLLNIVPDKIERIRTWLKTLKQRI